MKEFGFDIQKKIQAAAILARLEGGRIDKIRLLKLLYLADRETLKERGSPIIGGRVSALNHGPLHSDVYDMIKTGMESWSDFFTNDGHSVVLSADPGNMKLSPFEIGKLTQIFEKFKEIDTWAVVEKTHELPEWKLSWKEGTSQTIPLETTLDVLGFTQEEIDEICSNAESHCRMKNLLSCQ